MWDFSCSPSRRPEVFTQVDLFCFGAELCFFLILLIFLPSPFVSRLTKRFGKAERGCEKHSQALGSGPTPKPGTCPRAQPRAPTRPGQLFSPLGAGRAGDPQGHVGRTQEPPACPQGPAAATGTGEKPRGRAEVQRYLLQHYRLLLLQERLELGRREDLLHLLRRDHLRGHHGHGHGDLRRGRTRHHSQSQPWNTLPKRLPARRFSRGLPCAPIPSPLLGEPVAISPFWHTEAITGDTAMVQRSPLCSWHQDKLPKPKAPLTLRAGHSLPTGSSVNAI